MRIFFLFHDHNVLPTVATIEPRMVFTFWAYSPISLWGFSFECPFLTEKQGKSFAKYHLNIDT